MQPNPSSSSSYPIGDGKLLPVFATPNQLSFYMDDPNQHKQMITVYNPYDFPIRYRVLSTVPQNYVVVSTDGNIKARCYVYVFVKLSPAHTNTCNTLPDKLRIQMFEKGSKNAIGKKDIPVMLYAGVPPKTDDKEKFEQLVEAPSSIEPQYNQHQQHSINPLVTRPVRGGNSSNVVILVVAAMCIAALMLPTDVQQDSRFPWYMHLTLNQKLICAYTLGLVTMVLLRTQ